MTESSMTSYVVKPLGPDTWEAFAGLAERHNGVWNGCWCTWFHTFYADKDKERTAEDNRALKERLVNEGHAHAALAALVAGPRLYLAIWPLANGLPAEGPLPLLRTFTRS